MKTTQVIRPWFKNFTPERWSTSIKGNGYQELEELKKEKHNCYLFIGRLIENTFKEKCIMLFNKVKIFYYWFESKTENCWFFHNWIGYKITCYKNNINSHRKIINWTIAF